MPTEEIDMVYSVALTDHYFDSATLQRISDGMKAGRPRPSLPPEQEQELLKQLKASGVRRMLGIKGAARPSKGGFWTSIKRAFDRK